MKLFFFIEYSFLTVFIDKTDGDKPSKEQTVQHLRDIFYRMGFDE